VAGLNLQGADLSSTDISKMIFEETIMVGNIPYKLSADLRGVVYDSFTIWPPGFTPPK
jgi:16S rRNA A1518/A1519 N6-dimethyltransferase RsmA/KsgA/DIM1 with predicted DNA glycosylase/AP lyase activity